MQGVWFTVDTRPSSSSDCSYICHLSSLKFSDFPLITIFCQLDYQSSKGDLLCHIQAHLFPNGHLKASRSSLLQSIYKVINLDPLSLLDRWDLQRSLKLIFCLLILITFFGRHTHKACLFDNRWSKVRFCRLKRTLLLWGWATSTHFSCDEAATDTASSHSPVGIECHFLRMQLPTYRLLFRSASLLSGKRCVGC